MAFYETDIPEAISQTRHFLIIGRPSELPIIENLNDVMPVTFEAGSDLASERQMRVSYRFAPDTSLGYLQLFPSPWNRSQAILTVLGSTDQGLQWAANALLDADLRDALENNLAIISEDQLTNGPLLAQVDLQNQPETSSPAVVDRADAVNTTATVDTSDVVDTSDIASVSTPEETTPASAAPAIEILGMSVAGFIPIDGQPLWLVPVLAGSLLLTLVTILLAALFGWRQRRLASR
jgi:hypothetical protein